jgi:hypothetical protein
VEFPVELARPGQAQRVVIISLMKSGTHLLQELMVALGYGMYGAGVRLRPEILPVLDSETRWQVARLVYDEETVASLKACSEEHFTEVTDRGWDALSWSWHIRLAQPLTVWYSREMLDAGFVEQVHRRAVGSGFAETPPGVCWVFNQLDITRVDGRFLHDWTKSGEPKIIFNYRDPRDIILSMVNFLSNRTGRGFSNYNDFLVFSDILKSKATLDEQLTYALTDPFFPPQRDFQRMIWLLNHPNVCKTSFEELVGPRGGGSAESRDDTLTRIFEFLGVTGRKPADVAERLFNPDVFSFYRGQIGGWREVFTPEHQRLADDRFGDVLQLYGYE